MKLTYDPEKDARNIALRGISFEEAVNFNFSDALIWEDDREDYQEARFCALWVVLAIGCMPWCSRIATKPSESSACAKRIRER